MKTNGTFWVVVLALLAGWGMAGCATSGKSNAVERGNVTFHIIDEDATEEFYGFYRENPDTTFDENGELINRYIIPANVVMTSINDINKQGRNQRPFQFNIMKGKNDAGESRSEDTPIDKPHEDEPVAAIYDTEGKLVRTFYFDSDFSSDRNIFFNILTESIEFVAIHMEIGLDGYHIINVQVEKNKGKNDKPSVTFTLDSDGVYIFYRLTAANVGRYMAIIVGNTVRAIVRIENDIKGAVTIECDDLKEANDLARILKGGKI